MKETRRIRVRGQVQGVGFRPFIWRLAKARGLCGHVLNDAEGVLILASGADLDGFEAALRAEAPPLSRIDAVESAPAEELAGADFHIAATGEAGARTRVTPDAASCPACLAEISDPADRRHGYAFANCTHCGPRFSILRALPYDRAQTTMAEFSLCPACRAEYENPEDRRFHAQPVACAECGPHLWLEPEAPGEPLTRAAEMLRAGKIIAIKGIGGFHLACDARNPAAIALLRSRKRRPAKPLALMASQAVIARHARLSDAERARLESPAAPVLLLRKSGEPLPGGLAPGQNRLGWMLPHTPLHHLLLQLFDGPLVMTSGNLSGEPMVISNEEAREMLAPYADGFLMHNRAIARRLDDSVEEITPAGPLMLRRGRGRAPETLPLPPGFECAPHILAFGGHMKTAICLIKDNQALLSHHLGELDAPRAREAYDLALADYAAIFDHRPTLAAADLHPGCYATQRAGASGLPVEAVQHHHAHLAACLGENLWPADGGPVAGVILDGLGLGPDGTLWGGELLLGGYAGFTRKARLEPAPLPGGDAAARQPWRNLLARLDAAGCAEEAQIRLAGKPLAPLRMAIEKGLNAPLSSSAGRLFDAVAAFCGICAEEQSFEGEAAMGLQALAERCADAAPLPFGEGAEIGTAPLFHAMIRAGGNAGIAAGFHAGLAEAFASRARALVKSGEAKAVALSGGCFQNSLLLSETLSRLDGVPVLIHRKTPANDGSLALGQALVAAARRLAV